MSRRSAGARWNSRALLLLLSLSTSGSLGCWEQWSVTWFPQMKRQRAIQAFEEVTQGGQIQGFTPPAGTVPVGGDTVPPPGLSEAASDGLVNPRAMSLASVENGRAKYRIYCAACHGESGMGDGPVSMTGEINGPLGGVLPMVVSLARSDGHIYETIRNGRRRMPGYARIFSDDRWDIVNYVRFLTKQKGVQP